MHSLKTEATEAQEVRSVQAQEVAWPWGRENVGSANLKIRHDSRLISQACFKRFCQACGNLLPRHVKACDKKPARKHPKRPTLKPKARMKFTPKPRLGWNLQDVAEKATKQSQPGHGIQTWLNQPRPGARTFIPQAFQAWENEADYQAQKDNRIRHELRLKLYLLAKQITHTSGTTAKKIQAWNTRLARLKNPYARDSLKPKLARLKISQKKLREAKTKIVIRPKWVKSRGFWSKTTKVLRLIPDKAGNMAFVAGLEDYSSRPIGFDGQNARLNRQALLKARITEANLRSPFGGQPKEARHE